MFSEVEKEEFFDAIRRGDHHIVKASLKRGMSPDVANRSNKSALLYAALQGDDTCVRLLLAHGADATHLPMIEAVVSDNPAIMSRFLNMGANPNEPDASGRVPLMEAAYWGNKSVIAVLIENGADVRLA